MNELGKANYDGYRKASGGKSLVSGAALPEWDGLAPEIREAWTAGATDVVTVALVAEGLQQLRQERDQVEQAARTAREHLGHIWREGDPLSAKAADVALTALADAGIQ